MKTADCLNLSKEIGGDQIRLDSQRAQHILRNLLSSLSSQSNQPTTQLGGDYACTLNLNQQNKSL